MDMRDLITLCETPQSSSQTPPTIIRQLVTEYAQKGVSVEKIGSGWCEDFANNVLERWIGPDWVHQDGKGKFDCLETDGFYKYNENYDPLDWDWKLLKQYWGVSPPKGMSRSQLKKMIGANHVWIATGGKHYDAEAPDGVHSFFDLPFFLRWIAGIKAEGAR
jgi:hypothetical protein